MSAAGETLLAGQAHLQQSLCGLQFLVSPASFMQTNPVQAEVLYGLVLAAAGMHTLCRLCGVSEWTAHVHDVIANKAAECTEAPAGAVVDSL